MLQAWAEHSWKIGCQHAAVAKSLMWLTRGAETGAFASWQCWVAEIVRLRRIAARCVAHLESGCARKAWYAWVDVAQERVRITNKRVQLISMLRNMLISQAWRAWRDRAETCVFYTKSHDFLTENDDFTGLGTTVSWLGRL